MPDSLSLALDSPTSPPLSAAVAASLPRVVELSSALRADEAFECLASSPHCVFFDSAMRHETRGRYSYVAADPYAWLEVPSDGRPALPRLERLLASGSAERVEGLPPWQGGAAGVFGYEIGHSLERLPRTRHDEFRHAAIAVGVYDAVVAFDHETGRSWAISHGLPEVDAERRRRRADERMEWLLDKLNEPPTPRVEPSADRLALTQLAPAWPTPYGRGWRSDFSRDDYLRAVERVIEHLRAGDAFQVNLSQRLLAHDPGDPVALYQRLRQRNPAPFGGYFDGGDWQVLSASPERFLRLDDDRVETRPIKGTRPRDAGGDALLASDKDRAENVMIVDLLRNDLSRVCTDASVEVPELFRVEPYAHVDHLVSAVTGRLRPGCGVADLLAATLPGGSITGAPKVRAQEIIADLEPTARGAYCGVMAWIGWPDTDGRSAMDSSVLIRTLTRSRGWVQAPVGGGVVVQSDPAAEYDETWHKAVGLVDAVTPERAVG